MVGIETLNYVYNYCEVSDVAFAGSKFNSTANSFFAPTKKSILMDVVLSKKKIKNKAPY